MARVRPLRGCHVLYKHDAKHALIKILSKVSIRQFCIRFAFITECGLYGWIVSQSACSLRKRPEETRRGSARSLYLRRWYICTTYAFRCVKLASLSRDDDCACSFNYVHSTCSIGISGCIVVWSLCRGQESYSNNDEDQV